MSETYRKTQVTLPALSFKDREHAFITVLREMSHSTKVDESDDGREPATTMRVLNLEDNKQYVLVCPRLLVSALSEDAEKYVGKSYEIYVSAKPVPGKRYKSVDIWEIDADAFSADLEQKRSMIDSGN